MYRPSDFLDADGYPLAPEEIAELLNATAPQDTSIADKIVNMAQNAMQIGYCPNYVLVGKSTYVKLSQEIAGSTMVYTSAGGLAIVVTEEEYHLSLGYNPPRY